MLSLKTLLAVVLGAIAILAVSMIGMTTERWLSVTETKQIQERLNELAFQMRYRIDRAMFERYQDIQSTSSLDALHLGSDSEQHAILEQLKATTSDYAWVGLVDTEGKVVTSTGRLLEGTNVSRDPWFVAGLLGPHVGDVHEYQYLAALLPNNETETLRFVDLAAPVLASDGTIVGVLGAHLNWTWADEIMASILREDFADNKGEVFLLNGDGVVLLGPSESVGRPSPCPASVSTASTEYGRVTCQDGQDYMLGYARTEGYRTYPGLGWQILIRQPVEISLMPIAEYRWNILLHGVITAIVFMVVGWFLAAWIAHPLHKIASTAEQMRHGARGAGVPSSARYTEVASLTNSLTALIGDLTRTEKNLQSSSSEIARHQRLQSAIVDTMQDALFVNRGGEIVFVNSSCLRLVGATSPEQLIGSSPLDLFHLDFRPIVEERIRKLDRPGVQVPTIEERIICLDGRVIDVEVTATAFLDDGDLAILVIMRDLSTRKQTEQQLAHAQRMEAVGNLTGGMAHDFNNLLTIIIGNLDSLNADKQNDPRTYELVDMALNASMRGAELIRQLLAFSRQQALAPKTFQMNELVAGTTELLRHTLGERIEIRMELADELWPALADPVQLESAIANLAINARDAMPEGGVLKIETANRHFDEQYASENVEVVPGDYVMLAVSDTGTGMPKDVLARVFEPFFTTKQEGKGSGLGLSMIYGFAKQSRGYVKIYSEPDHGTTVHLYIPRAMIVGSPKTAEESVAQSESISDATILVIEDKSDVRQVVVRQLVELGYHVIEAEDGDAALAIIESNSHIDLLFTDIVISSGRTGIEIAEEARKLRPNLKVIFTSGFAEIMASENAAAKALGPLLSKPYRRQELARLIREVLREQRTA